jgi:hypothetical protein
MRLAEKTIELNYCAQLNERLGRRVIWFGLTQRQEARAGYDAYAQLGGQLVALQFKASNHVLLSGARRFHAPHHQLAALRDLGRRRPNSVFYVFPGVGTTLELAKDPDVVGQSQVLDAGRIPLRVGPPMQRSGRPRRRGAHYIDVTVGIATIHSDPVEVRLYGPGQLLEAPARQAIELAELDRTESIMNADGEQDWFDKLLSVASGSSIGAVILPGSG